MTRLTTGEFSHTIRRPKNRRPVEALKFSPYGDELRVAPSIFPFGLDRRFHEGSSDSSEKYRITPKSGATEHQLLVDADSSHQHVLPSRKNDVSSGLPQSVIDVFDSFIEAHKALDAHRWSCSITVWGRQRSHYTTLFSKNNI